MPSPSDVLWFVTIQDTASEYSSMKSPMSIIRRNAIVVQKCKQE